MTSPDDLRQRPALGVGLDGDHAVAIEVVDPRRPDGRRDPSPPGRAACVAAGPRPPTGSGSDRGRRRRRARLGSEPDVTSRVSPAGSIQSPTSMPANAGRSACATWPTVTPERSRPAAIELHVELRLLSLRREPDVDGAGHLSARPGRPPSGQALSAPARRCRAPAIWICFSPGLKPCRSTRSRRRRREAPRAGRRDLDVC